MPRKETYRFAPSYDPRLNRVMDMWHTFSNSIDRDEKVGIVYHGDMDGLVGAAYIRRTLMQWLPETMLKTYWVSTDEYDFESLRGWIEEQNLKVCVFTDVSIENHLPTLEFVSRHVSKQVFIYDHHFVNAEADKPNVILANPTPEKLKKGEVPIPTFLFAYRVASENGFRFPDWLLLLSMFAEGVNSYFDDDARALFERVFEKRPSRSVQEDYKRTALSRLSNLIRAGFSLPGKSETALRLLDGVITGETNSYVELRSQLADEFEETASNIASDITRYLDEWKKNLESERYRNSLVVFIPIDASHTVAGPVASILRGEYPDKVLITYFHRDDKVIFELRTRNDTDLNLAEILGRVGMEVELINYGGHPMAAGAIIQGANLNRFTKSLEREILNDSH